MYRISFYGDRKPETLPDSRGKALYEDYQKGELPVRVEIRQGLTVESKSIREIELISDSSSRNNQGMSPAEIRHFEERELLPFLTKHLELTPDQELAFLVGKGLIRVVMTQGTTYKTASDASIYIQPHAIEEYTKMVDKLEQWKVYAGRRNFAQKKAREEYDEEVRPLTGVWSG